MYAVVGIARPGRINVKFNGKFRDVNLFDMNQSQLQELYNNKCPYVKQLPDADLSEIKTEKIIPKNKRESKTKSKPEADKAS